MEFRRIVSSGKRSPPDSISTPVDKTSRLGVIVPLVGSVDTDSIPLISAAAFGAPHLRGMPGSIVDALMAGLLGWLFAKLVMETNGMFWAWFIYFLQDIVIFSAFVMAAATTAFEQDAPKAARSSANASGGWADRGVWEPRTN